MFRRYGVHGITGIGGLSPIGLGSSSGGIAIAYLLRDDYSDIRAAGAVNGTLADPGPGGARVVNDTGNRLSINGNLAVFAGGAAAWGDPGLWYSSYARTFGRYLKFRANQSVSGSNILGWDTNQATFATHGIELSGLTIRAVVNGTGLVVATYALSTDYDFVVLLKPTGFYLYVKGGAYSSYTMLYSSFITSTTPMYPAFTNNSAIFTLDFARIPDRLFAAPVSVYDSFTDPNGTSLDAHTSDATGPCGAAQATDAQSGWTESSGDFDIQGNEANTVAAGGLGIAVVNQVLEADGLIECDVTPTGGREVGILYRFQDTSNCWWAAISSGGGGQIRIRERNGGVETLRASAAAAVVDGNSYRMNVIMDGQTTQAFVSNGSRITWASALFQTEDEHGLKAGFLAFPHTSGHRWDNWAFYNRTDVRYDAEFSPV